jgi:hypothetical protein
MYTYKLKYSWHLFSISLEVCVNVKIISLKRHVNRLRFYSIFIGNENIKLIEN